jgi:hypothetical protein
VFPYGANCSPDDNLCHALCLTSSDCESDCCIPLSGGTYGNCGPAQSGYTCQ